MARAAHSYRSARRNHLRKMGKLSWWRRCERVKENGQVWIDIRSIRLLLRHQHG